MTRVTGASTLIRKREGALVIRPTVRRSLFGAFATIGIASFAALMIPLASADPELAPADDCNASTLATTASSVNAALSITSPRTRTRARP